ncbi:hypothetical protein H1Z61_17305 [Bacillus aquiflavi]|uniref:Uncharacterized protein n=1 Tax=Bacillus aquiflavi TaxID=2672567 RepID=A0A6B3VY44_9BACI|nr:hypothetical protein [Bacillus aquiflavi]MBA4538831.1 hypothetical protein [Bacillus aquiflavi]NEY83190.1 hypothetical protein [Bacillus aquiflavi]UAC48543.1 hypothetical protein K6959_00620 [Bacillus aquiflavi]
MEKKEQSLLPKDMDPKDLPKGRAFEDEFTRSFLQSTEEMMPGYYPFLSQNGKYTMAFPREGLTGDRIYLSGENHESLNIAVWEEDADIVADIQVKYYGFLNPGYENNNKISLQSMMGTELNFEEVKGDGQTLYVSFFQDEKEAEGDDDVYGYAGYLQNDRDAGGIDLIYTSRCKRNCEQLKEKDLKQAYKWITSVKFVHEKTEKEEN